MRRAERRIAHWLVLSCWTLVACSEAPQIPDPAREFNAQSPADKTPNLVVLFADDLGYGDLGSYGHPYIRTPNLDQLAREGQRWTDFYVAAAVCSPSRAALLTGRLPVRTGQYGDLIGVYFPDEVGGFPDAEVTLAEALQGAGYRTGMFGKWHLGDAPHALPTRHGFDEWLGLPYSNDMDWVGEPGIDEIIAMTAAGRGGELAELQARRAASYADPQPGMWNVPLLRSVRSEREDGYHDEVVARPADQAALTSLYTDAAIDFMRRAGDSPFFIYLPYTMPHTPLFAGERFDGASLGGRYGDVVEEIDASAGAIRAALEELGVANNTLVIFTSDNGPWLTMEIEGGSAGLLRGGKSTTFEGGMRVPGIFWWPGRIAPGTVSGIGSTLDLFPTFAAVAGIDAKTAVDGIDLGPALFQGAPSPRQELAYYRGSTLYAYRQGPWKMHLVTQGGYGAPPERTVHEPPVLHDLRRDPSERFDVAQEQPDMLAALQAAQAAHEATVTRAPPAFDMRLQRASGQAPAAERPRRD